MLQATTNPVRQRSSEPISTAAASAERLSPVMGMATPTNAHPGEKPSCSIPLVQELDSEIEKLERALALLDEINGRLGL